MAKVTEPYDEAVRTGLYEKPTGLRGKYDNVRRFWEDQVTWLFLRPYLEPLVAEEKEIRILDLGCGSGDGYDLFTNIPAQDASFSAHEVRLITGERLEFYRGFDVNPVLVEKGRDLYKRDDKVEFFVGDFSCGLPPEVGESPYDIYFTSYGTLSHNDDEQNIRLISDIARHSGKHGLVVGDWLGRYSYEWQSLWTKDLERVKTMDYVISYLYSDGEWKGKELEHFPLRLMSREEVENVVAEASKQAGVEIKIKQLFDRSILVGRHMDTGDYNEHCRPLRKEVNSLFEANVRTKLENLLLGYHPKPGFDSLNDFFQQFKMSWNALVQFTIELLHSRENVIPPHYPRALQKAMQVMKKVVQDAGHLGQGDPRADIIEPQLGYCLRGLEMGLQQGMGTGHGMVAIMEIEK